PLGASGALIGVTDLRLLALAAVTALLASVLPYTLELSALRRLPRHVFGILLSLEPVVALLAGVLLLSQEVTVLRVLAAALVVGASIGVTLTAQRARPEQPQPDDEESDWELPSPTHATGTGERPALAEQAREGRGRGASPRSGAARSPARRRGPGAARPVLPEPQPRARYSRFRAEMMASREARVIEPSMPTPQKMRSPISHSM